MHFPQGPMLNYVPRWRPCWISDRHQIHKLYVGPSSDHSCIILIQSVKRFLRRCLYVFPIGSYVKLCFTVAAILDFGSATKTQTWQRTILGSFTPCNKSIGCVVSGKKIFKNISQSECIIGPGGQVEIPIGTNFTNLVEVTQ